MLYNVLLLSAVQQSESAKKKKKTHGDFAIHDCQIIYRMVK